MPKLSRFLLISFTLYGALVAAGIDVLGMLEQHVHPSAHDGIFVGWGIFIGQFAIFLALIDIPVVVLAIWIGQRLDATMERVGRETLERALPIATRLFTAQWEAERAAGRLPVPPEATEGKEIP